LFPPVVCRRELHARANVDKDHFLKCGLQACDCGGAPQRLRTLSPLVRAHVVFTGAVRPQPWSAGDVQGAASQHRDADNWEAGQMPALPPQR
jgi:hypothetical protein